MEVNEEEDGEARCSVAALSLLTATRLVPASTSTVVVSLVVCFVIRALRSDAARFSSSFVV
jgi:hypothetical protein